ncbi:hypothetical protein VTO42DRAFT_5489 [Malbranchea cinnamomea]
MSTIMMLLKRIPRSLTTSGLHDTIDPVKTTGTLRQFRHFDLEGKVYVVTGGGRGLGLSMAEILAEAGGRVYGLDILKEPDKGFTRARQSHALQGSLHYRQLDVRNVDDIDKAMCSIASGRNRLDGIIAAAGIPQVGDALQQDMKAAHHAMEINFFGVSTQPWPLQSKSNKGMLSSVYNSSKAAVVQLGRNLAMEWGKVDENGGGGIRVNCLCPGHILTPMVQQTLQMSGSDSQAIWEGENMLGRLATPEEFRGVALFLLSDASSFMTGSTLVIDGGHSAW